jgi:hypothetical protein
MSVIARSKLVWIASGVALGLVAGLNLAGLWPQAPLHAMATHGQDTFAICTSPMDEDMEAVFILDDVTGDLKGAALNIQTRRFTTFFEYNVMRDLPTPNIKNPHYRIVSGNANMRQNVAAGPVAHSVIYVAEVTSGQMVAYTVPWVNARASAVVPLRAAVIPLDRWQFRTAPSRNP